MISVKELRSIDITSYTIITTAISILFSLLASIALIILIGILSPQSIGIALYLIPTIIVGTFMWGIYHQFTNGLLFNFLSTKLRNIKIGLDENEIIKISTSETATIIATITLIQAVLIYLVTVLIVPLLLSTLLQTLMLTGQQLLAYGVYQALTLISQPITILMLIFGSFVMTFICILLGCYIYNFIASKGRGIALELSQENGMTVVDSIDMMKFAIALAIISGILSVIYGIIMAISGVSIVGVIGNIISGFIGGFLSGALIAIFYNILAPRFGKLKLELIDLKIN